MQHEYIRSPGKRTVERNKWIILTSVPSITNIFFYYFADIAMDNDIEMLDDDHLQLLFADSPPLSEDDPASLPGDAPGPADELAPEPAPPAPAPLPDAAPPPPPPPPALHAREDAAAGQGALHTIDSPEKQGEGQKRERTSRQAKKKVQKP